MITVGGVLGHPPEDTHHDTRVDLPDLLRQGFTYIVGEYKYTHSTFFGCRE